MTVFWDIAPHSLVELKKLADVSEVLTASIIKAMIRTSPHGFAVQKTNIYIFTVVRSSNISPLLFVD
jgi:hypothetical protein